MKYHFVQLTSVKTFFWGVLILTIVAFAAITVLQPLSNVVMNNHVMFYMVMITLCGSLLFLCHFLVIAVLTYCYNALSPGVQETLPGCTVIVPAYNEGEHVAETLYSLMECDYPPEKLEIIAINDGSKDDTWKWIKKVADTSAGRITPVNLRKNGGKKHALYTGIKTAKFELIVTVDSDSIVEKSALKNLVAPFSDPAVGGVAGYIRVKNINKGIIPLLMDIGFVFGCEFIRRAQSVVGSVLCTPGALSAYRKSAILPYCDEWLEQTFLGVPSHIGEDRAITTLLLRNGFKVVYQANAVANTCVPENYRQLCRMLIRWTRSDVRENIVLGKYVYRQNPLRSFPMLILQINLTMQIFGFVLASIAIPFWLLTAVISFSTLHYIFIGTLFMTALWSAIPVVTYYKECAKNDLIWVFVFGVYSLFALSWIIPYSIFTVRNSKWLTRDIMVAGRKHSSGRKFGVVRAFRLARIAINTQTVSQYSAFDTMTDEQILNRVYFSNPMSFKNFSGEQ